VIIQAFNYLDGLALGVVLQNIKVDLSLSDTQLGVLSGIAFALFYSVMGIPIARWADRGNRVTIISLTACVWSVMVALCGLASSFTQLLLIRVGVAVGEAGCIPPAHSLIADYFSRAERPRAVAVYMLGGSLSTLIGYFLAGWLNQFYGWRAMFIMLGLPGLVPALVAWLTLREPRTLTAPGDCTAAVSSAQSLSSRNVGSNADRPSVREVFATLWANVTFRHLLICFAVMNFFGSGILQWQPAFFVRSFGLQTGELGTWFAVIYGVGGLLGTYWGGELAARFAANKEHLQLRVMSWIYTGFAIISACIYLSPNRYVAFAMVGLAALGGATTNGPLFATIQTLVPPRMRAVSIAVIYLFANLIGAGLGPLLSGALSDMLRPYLGEESLRYALLSLCPGYFWAAGHVWRASTSVASDLRAVQLTGDDSRKEELVNASEGAI
jgi:MFS family permease